MTDNDQKLLDELTERGVYIVQDFASHCKVCDQLDALREGCCFTCAEAESIIVDGTDMYDKGPDGNSIPAQTGMQKLEFLSAKGWKNNSRLIAKANAKIAELTATNERLKALVDATDYFRLPRSSKPYETFFTTVTLYRGSMHYSGKWAYGSGDYIYDSAVEAFEKGQALKGE